MIENQLLINNKGYWVVILLIFLTGCTDKKVSRTISSFNENWQFHLEDSTVTDSLEFTWRNLDLPHDWSIEGKFDENNPATFSGGALPGGIGWYKKSFTLNNSEKDKNISIRFDGIYMNSEVWINGHYLGKRPYGYISFAYDLTPFLKFNGEDNELKVKVDNSVQPNSRWYSGSGIYRNVWLLKTDKLHVDTFGTFVYASNVSESQAMVHSETTLKNNYEMEQSAILNSKIVFNNKTIAEQKDTFQINPGKTYTVANSMQIQAPELWSLEKTNMYSLISDIYIDKELVDSYETPFGIRDFTFDYDKGFILNGKPVKIKGVCNHHDLGALGAAINIRALERRLEIMRDMGVNAIRTSHNPPAPELLDLCDKMGFIVMDEAFDIWKIAKTKYDYSLHFDDWHQRDLVDFIKRDRNHPSIFIWSIGNEVMEQWDSTGIEKTRELAAIVKKLDTTRPITTANNPPYPTNYVNVPDVLDLIGYNYAHEKYIDHKSVFPNRPFIATETTSALATRGYYDARSDTIQRWPIRWDIPFTGGNPGNTVSAYDHVSTPWGSTHEETWKVIKKYDFLSGMFIWTGFDYLGEPTPYTWPSRSSYFGIVDLAGFPKDAYYMYQSEWTDTPMLHIFPHWNWEVGKEVDIWAYYNQADEVELFLNGESLGIRKKEGDDLHVMWRVPFVPGTLKAVSRKDGKEVQVKEIKTAGEPNQILLEADRDMLQASGDDLSFITVQALDNKGIPVPIADNLIQFSLEGDGKIVGVDNGDPTSHEPFKAMQRKLFYGKCLVIVKGGKSKGEIQLKASSHGLKEAEQIIKVN